MTVTQKTLYDKKSKLVQKMEALNSKYKGTSTSYTESDSAKFDEYDNEIALINKQLRVEEVKGNNSATEAIKRLLGESGDVFQDEEENNGSKGFTILKKSKPDTSLSPISDFALRNYDVHEDTRKANVYSVLSALATGKPNNRFTEAALGQVRSVSGGGSILNPFLSAQLWDGGIAKSHLAQLGMKTLLMESDSHKFAKITGYPNFEWAAAGAQTSDKTATIGSVSLDAKTFRGFVKVDGELLDSGLNTTSVLEQMFNTAAGNAIDTAGLIGSGVGAEPQGIKNYSNVNVYSMGTNGAQLSNYDPYLEATKLIYDDNAPTPTGAIMAPRTWLTQSKFKATDNQPLQLPPALRDMTFRETSKIPVADTQGSSNLASSIYLGGFDKLFLGVLLNTTIIITPVAADTFTYNFFLVFRGDFKPEREENFGVIKGIIP